MDYSPRADGMRHRTAQPAQPEHYSTTTPTNPGTTNKSMKRRFAKKIDLFPKIEIDLCEASTDQGARLLLFTFLLAATLILAEYHAWSRTNSTPVQTVVVDTSLNRKMRVDLNISFPALHCDDLHLDLMDVAGDVQLDVEDTMVKRRLHKSDGTYLSKDELEVQMNRAHAKEVAAKEAVTKTLVKGYCGPCYGAGEIEQCCNYCEDVMEAYKKKSWHVEQVKSVAEQCIREHKTGAKPMSKGEGCQIAGFMTFNRLNGNFHIAMGEGVERNGHHIHTFLPDDMENFNASHVIHDLRFGPVYDSGTMLGEMNALNGVQKIVKKSDGSTGTFQYFIKIVPTTYKGKDLVNSLIAKKKVEPRKLGEVYKAPNVTGTNEEPILETNRYFTTERFVPLMQEDLDEEHYDLGEQVLGIDPFDEYDDDGTIDDEGGLDDDNLPAAGVKVGGNTGSTHSHHHNHRNKQQILPGVFFIYQIYPFAVEVSRDRVPVMHLLIRIMATVGGLFTIVGWLDMFMCSRKKRSYR